MRNTDSGVIINKVVECLRDGKARNTEQIRDELKLDRLPESLFEDLVSDKIIEWDSRHNGWKLVSSTLSILVEWDEESQRYRATDFFNLKYK
jgi:hypothetical protein